MPVIRLGTMVLRAVRSAGAEKFAQVKLVILRY